MRALTTQGPKPTAEGCAEELREAPRQEKNNGNLKKSFPGQSRTDEQLASDGEDQRRESQTRKENRKTEYKGVP